MAPPTRPNDDDGERAVTGDDQGPGEVGGTDDYPADGSTPARGDSVPRND